MSETLPTGQLSNIPWRRTGVKYTNNEAYFDVVEEVSIILNKLINSMRNITIFRKIKFEITEQIECCKMGSVMCGAVMWGVVMWVL